MFYKKGIDITNAKEMFEFLDKHFCYYTFNSWNAVRTIANCVKLYKLNLDGDWSTALDLLQQDNGYEEIDWMIEDWNEDHLGYRVEFNGSSGGYLILLNSTNRNDIRPEWCGDGYTYEEFKRWCKDFYGSVKAYMPDLRELCQLVQDFDKLCDKLRDYCNDLSKADMEAIAHDNLVELLDDVENCYSKEIEKLEVSVFINDDRKLDAHEAKEYPSLLEAILNLAKRYILPGFKLNCSDISNIFYEEDK